MNNIRSKLYKLMSGRYGNDQLNQLITAFTIVFYLIGGLTKFIPLMLISLIGLGISIFRCFSKNITKRQTENSIFIQKTSKLIKKINSHKYINLIKLKYKYRNTHIIFLCSKCKQTIRIPKNKGKIEVTCPKCHAQMIKKS